MDLELELLFEGNTFATLDDHTRWWKQPPRFIYCYLESSSGLHHNSPENSVMWTEKTTRFVAEDLEPKEIVVRSGLAAEWQRG